MGCWTAGKLRICLAERVEQLETIQLDVTGTFLPLLRLLTPFGVLRTNPHIYILILFSNLPQITKVVQVLDVFPSCFMHFPPPPSHFTWLSRLGVSNSFTLITLDGKNIHQFPISFIIHNNNPPFCPLRCRFIEVHIFKIYFLKLRSLRSDILPWALQLPFSCGRCSVKMRPSIFSPEVFLLFHNMELIV
jgi:hypothetical protein